MCVRSSALVGVALGLCVYISTVQDRLFVDFQRTPGRCSSSSRSTPSRTSSPADFPAKIRNSRILKPSNNAKVGKSLVGGRTEKERFDDNHAKR